MSSSTAFWPPSSSAPSKPCFSPWATTSPPGRTESHPPVRRNADKVSPVSDGLWTAQTENKETGQRSLMKHHVLTQASGSTAAYCFGNKLFIYLHIMVTGQPSLCTQQSLVSMARKASCSWAGQNVSPATVSELERKGKEILSMCCGGRGRVSAVCTNTPAVHVPD